MFITNNLSLCASAVNLPRAGCRTRPVRGPCYRGPVRADLPTLLPLICPACRRVTERGRELFTVSLSQIARIRTPPPNAPNAPSRPGAPPEVEEGVLTCENPDCARSYPIFDGIPILVPDLGGFLAGQLAALGAELEPEVAALLAEPGPDDAPIAQLLEHLSIYLDAHWGDLAVPAIPGAGAFEVPGFVDRLGLFGGRALFQALGERAPTRVACAVELGCSVGRGLLELARGADLVVGVELHLGALRKARRLLLGEAVRYPRRVLGRSYVPARIDPAQTLSAERGSLGLIGLVCGDALDPPLAPYQAGRVVALNVLDSVRSPTGLLSVVDGLCAPGGELILTSPYAFRSGVVDEGERLGGTSGDAASAVRDRLTSGHGLGARYRIEDERDLPWHLRRDARSVQSYAVHWLRARREPEAYAHADAAAATPAAPLP